MRGLPESGRPRVAFVEVVLLGTAAGGGFPQWNCWCRSCQTARRDPSSAIPRSQSSLAIRARSGGWVLLNASPDVREQLRQLENGIPASVRHVPTEAVALTDAELDHSLGLVLLREARQLQLYATAAVEHILTQDSRLLAVTRAFADVRVEGLLPGQPTALRNWSGGSLGLTLEPVTVAAGPPRFAARDETGHTVGFIIREAESGATCAYFPGCGAITPVLMDRLAAANILLFDGTFWSDDEMIRLGVGERTALALDHLPVGGADGSLAQLRTLPCPTKVYVHINNTNPMLLEGSAEQQAVEAAGMIVGRDGMRFEI